MSFRPKGEIFLSSLAFARVDGVDPSPLRPLRPFDFAQDMLCGRYSELWLRLCRAGISTTNTPGPLLCGLCVLCG